MSAVLFQGPCRQLPFAGVVKAIFLHQLVVFLLVSLMAMVRLLIADISIHGCELGTAHGYGEVVILPPKFLRPLQIAVGPKRRFSFEQIGNCS